MNSKQLFVMLLVVATLGGPVTTSSQEANSVAGTVTNVDFTSGMITIAHEPNRSLGLDQSTDLFRVTEPMMLNALRLGAKVKIAATRINGQLSITKILSD